MPLLPQQNSAVLDRNQGDPRDDSRENRCQRGLNIVVGLQSSALRLTGILHDLIPGEVLISVDHPLPEGSAVTIELQNAHLHGEVVYSAPKNGRYEANVLIPDSEGAGLRHAPRFTVDLPAKIFPADEVESVEGRLVDISSIGIGLEVPIALQTGEVVAVETDANVTFGVVRYCRPVAEGGFRAGAETYHVMPKEKKRPARKSWLSNLLSALERF